ncbi:MAG: hypothetical protein ACYCSN_01535 [Acidobacteriaceae bacterium]
MGRRRSAAGLVCALAMLCCVLSAARPAAAASSAAAVPPAATNALHTDPLNLDPAVRDAFQHFYNLDYDGSLARFDAVLEKHPQDPMAVDYVLLVTLFRELYHLDLLDTTLYAHEGFLTSKRLVNESPAVRAQIMSLIDQATALSNDRLKINPSDKDALFTRGYARSMNATYIGLVDHSFVSGLHKALQARSDHEKVLQIDPQYVDAKMVVGIHLFAVASLPGPLRFMAGIAGLGGSKTRGLQDLEDAAAYGTITRVESKTVLSLFLRHDARYQEALVWSRELTSEYPHDYLFRLEEANLTKDSGQGLKAIALYRGVLHDAQRKGYFYGPRLQLAWFGLAETLRGQNDLQGAADGFLQAAAQPDCSAWLKRRSELSAGEMFDLLHKREEAIQQYQLAMGGGGDPSQADAARKYARSPYTAR